MEIQLANINQLESIYEQGRDREFEKGFKEESLQFFMFFWWPKPITWFQSADVPCFVSLWSWFKSLLLFLYTFLKAVFKFCTVCTIFHATKYCNGYPCSLRQVFLTKSHRIGSRIYIYIYTRELGCELLEVWTHDLFMQEWWRMKSILLL